MAIFGLGDQGGYGDNFCDAMDELKTCFANQGAEIVGAWPTEGYDHMESKSVEGDKFVGAPQPSLHGPQAPAGTLACRTAYSCCAIARAQAWRATRTTSRTCPRSA